MLDQQRTGGGSRVCQHSRSNHLPSLPKEQSPAHPEWPSTATQRLVLMFQAQ